MGSSRRSRRPRRRRSDARAQRPCGLHGHVETASRSLRRLRRRASVTRRALARGA
jgi:hypothetical protein